MLGWNSWGRKKTVRPKIRWRRTIRVLELIEVYENWIEIKQLAGIDSNGDVLLFPMFQ